MSKIEMTATETISNKISKNFNNLHFLLFLIIWCCWILFLFLTHCFTMMKISFVLSFLIIIKDLLIKQNHKLTVNNNRQKIKILLTIEVNLLYFNFLYLSHVLSIKTADQYSQYQKMISILQEMINISHPLCLCRHGHIMTKPMRMKNMKIIMNMKTITATLIMIIKRWHKSISATITMSTTYIDRIKSTIIRNTIQVRSINQISHIIRMKILTSTMSYQSRTLAARNTERSLHLIIFFINISVTAVLQ